MKRTELSYIYGSDVSEICDDEAREPLGEKEDKMIISISVDKLEAHPDNPRKELKDIDELSQSIKKSGILQNLTVVKIDDDRYRVIIGHRRLEAAKLAGLTEVPCSIADMDEKQQLATMLLENMQRTDLTPYEQAKGFQMMLDLGESVVDIAEKTGFSESTVRHRVKLLELDEQKLKEVCREKQVSMSDLIKLEQVKNHGSKNLLLNSIGTNNFDSCYQTVINNQIKSENAPLIKAELDSFAKKITQEESYSSKYDTVIWNINFLTYEQGSIRPKDADNTEYFYVWDLKYYTAKLLEKAEKKKKPQKSKEEKEREEYIKRKKADAEEITKMCYQLRSKFLDNLTPSQKQIPIILKYLTMACIEMRNEYYSFPVARLLEAVGEEEKYTFASARENTAKLKERYSESLSAVTVAVQLGDGEKNGYYGINYSMGMPEHRENTKLDLLYEYLEALGYGTSDEEKRLADGTHEIFKSIRNS